MLHGVCAFARACESAGVKTFENPKRFTSLNECDYALWTEINKMMRAQEKRMPSNKRESRAEFLKRLKRTALRLPPQLRRGLHQADAQAMPAFAGCEGRPHRGGPLMCAGRSRNFPPGAGT